MEDELSLSQVWLIHCLDLSGSGEGEKRISPPVMRILLHLWLRSFILCTRGQFAPPPPEPPLCVHHIYASVFPLCKQVIVNEDCVGRGPRRTHAACCNGVITGVSVCSPIAPLFSPCFFLFPLFLVVLLCTTPHVWMMPNVVGYPSCRFHPSCFQHSSAHEVIWKGKHYGWPRQDCICNLIQSSVSHCLLPSPLLGWFDNRNAGSWVLLFLNEC